MRSEYFAIFIVSSSSSGSMFWMIFLVVLSDPYTAPVAADDRKKETRTTQRYR